MTGVYLVRREVRGREHHLQLSAEPLRAAAHWAEGYARFWRERLDALARHLEEEPRNGT